MSNPLRPAGAPAEDAPAQTPAPSLSTDSRFVEVELPSKGLLYGPDSPVPTPVLPGGIVSIRKTTIAEEEAMWSAQGDSSSRMTRMLNSVCRLPHGFDSASLLATDRVFLMIALRRLNFGPNYKVQFKCEACGARQTTNVDVVQDLNLQEPAEDLSEPLLVELADVGRIIGLRFRRGSDEAATAAAARVAERRGQAHSLVEESLMRMIVVVDGVPFADALTKRDLIRQMTSTDLFRIRSTMDRNEPGVDLRIYPTCTAGQEVNEMGLPFSEDFFRPSEL